MNIIKEDSTMKFVFNAFENVTHLLSLNGTVNPRIYSVKVCGSALWNLLCSFALGISKNVKIFSESFLYFHLTHKEIRQHYVYSTISSDVREMYFALWLMVAHEYSSQNETCDWNYFLHTIQNGSWGPSNRHQSSFPRSKDDQSLKLIHWAVLCSGNALNLYSSLQNLNLIWVSTIFTDSVYYEFAWLDWHTYKNLSQELLDMLTYSVPPEHKSVALPLYWPSYILFCVDDIGTHCTKITCYYRMNLTLTDTWGFPRKGTNCYDGVVGLLQCGNTEIGALAILYKESRMDRIDYAGETIVFG